MSLLLPLTRPVEFDKLGSKVRKAFPTSLEFSRWPNRIHLRKYDGVCGLAVFGYGAPAEMLSRTGENYSMSCGLLLDHLARALQNYGWDGSPVMLAGEVWRPNCPQPKISGDFRQQHSIIEDFEFRMFDMVYLNQEPGKQPYYVRMDRYRELAAMSPIHHGIGWAEKVELRQDETPEQAAQRMGPGFDGIVAWDLLAVPLMDAKARNGEAVKFKPNITVDVRCTGGGLGEGKHANRLGYLTYATEDGKTGSVGTGFSDAEREDLWTRLVRGTNSPSGGIFEVEAMGLTPDGNLREPRFKGFRFDKKESD